MIALLKQAQNFTKLVAASKKVITIEDVIEAQENARKYSEIARKLYGTYFLH